MVQVHILVPLKNLTSVSSDIIGWKYDLDVILPRTYFRLDTENKKQTSQLTLQYWMKFAVGLSKCGT